MATTRLRPRSLALRNESKILSRNAVTANSSATSSDPSDPPLAGPGDMQLINYYKPALEGGIYTINIGQRIDLPSGATNNINTAPDNPGPQRFKVVAPRFKIDVNEIHSTYPPQGHADQPMILPHCVFMDPHLPFERSVSIAETFVDDDIMPWLAVVPFDINAPTDPELRLTAAQLDNLTAVLQPPDALTLEQSTTCTITMPLSKYLQLGSNNSGSGIAIHIPPFSQDLDWPDMQNDSTSVEVIFLSGSLFNCLFASRTNSAKLDISQFRYCAHVRNINTQGMADSGVEDTGLFSVLYSIRTGPTDIAQNTAPRTQAVHILNLEYIEKMTVPAAGDLVALVSLYSWTYLCQPPLSVNFVDAMRNIGDQIKTQTSLLRYSDAVIAHLSDNAGQGAFQKVIDATETATIQELMKKRFANGYSLVRHRTAPGQVTVVFTRSPLVPVIVSRPETLPASSNNGQDYQILDQSVGIMDITYSTAFQFGKTLASGDMGFVSALMRIRSDVHMAGVAAADTAVADPAVTPATKIAVMSALPATVQHITNLANAAPTARTPNLKGRWSQAKRPVSKSARDVDSPIWQEAYVQGVKSRMALVASATPASAASASTTITSKMNTKITTNTNAPLIGTGTTASGTSSEASAAAPYNDLASPYSTDWAFLFNWILDKLYLDAIPVHYLITDPAHLPVESIRFFHLDPVWLDCLIDGALSVANHLSKDDDVIRQFIKAEINNYLSTPVGSGPTAHLPQVPLYGFFLRSAVVKVFPDLQITIPYANGDNAGLAPILVRRMASDIMMILLDRLPDGGKISSIRFTQPVHQQCFSAGDSLDDSTIEFLFRKVYRNAANQAAATDALHEFGIPHSFSRTNISESAYDWTSRCLNFVTIEQALFNGTHGLVAAMPTEWGSPVQPLLTSSMAGIQLNDTIKYLEILPSQDLVMNPVGINLPRQIFIGQTSTSMIAKNNTNVAPAPKTLIARSTKVTVQKPLSLLHTSIPVIEQHLPRPRSTSSAKIQPRSLAKTPAQLNTLTGTHALSKTAATASGDIVRTSGDSKASGTAPSAPSVSATSPAASMTMEGTTRGLAVTAAALPVLSNPFPYPPPIPQVPQFGYAIYPSTTIYTKSILPTRFVNTTNPYPPDIIFSIILNDTLLVNRTLQLHEIDFRIPIGDPSLRTDLAKDILGGIGLVPVDSSPGIAARMLSNQRWVVHMDISAAYLNLRVIPRTLNLAVPILQNTTLSFKLNEVQIAGPNGKSITSGRLPVFVNVVVTEIYGFYADAARTRWVNQGSAQQQFTIQRK